MFFLTLSVFYDSWTICLTFFLLNSGKKGSDDLFDKLDTSKLNAHLKELMPGLTAKVFRTYNASYTLDDMVRCMTFLMLTESLSRGNCKSFILVFSANVASFYFEECMKLHLHPLSSLQKLVIFIWYTRFPVSVFDK